MATISTNSYTIGGIDLYYDASIAHSSLLATYTGEITPGSPFRKAGRSLGNIVTAEFAPDVTYVDHFIAVKGARRKDKTVANLKTVTIPFTFDEMNEANLKKFFLASTLGNNKLAPMENPLEEGSISMLVRTDIGPDLVYSIPKCTIKPDGNLAMNIEDWWSGPLVIEVLYYDTGQWASKPYGVLDTTP
uniref:Uncharacterized protein n=1 Tax=viral metagenome TaxID=1070528 RepID=A0A6M3IL03_9ZZZZ